MTALDVLVVEDWHVVGATGEPDFITTGTAVFAKASNATADIGFYKDPFGRVYLRGLVQLEDNTAYGASSGLPVFQLPEGYRPTDDTHFFAIDTSDYDSDSAPVTTEAFVDTSGAVNVRLVTPNPQYYSLDQINFRV